MQSNIQMVPPSGDPLIFTSYEQKYSSIDFNVFSHLQENLSCRPYSTYLNNKFGVI